MAFTYTKEMEEERENFKKAKIEELKVIRKTSPNEITQKEVSILKDLMETCSKYGEQVDLVFPSVIRTKSAEQMSELMNKLNISKNFWIQTFHGLEDTAEDRNLGKYIIQATAQCDRDYSGEHGLINIYKQMLKGSSNDYYPQSLVKDPEMASEILTCLNDILQKNNNANQLFSDDILETRRFLSSYDIWDGIVANKGNKVNLHNSYEQLYQTVQNIEIAMLTKQHLQDKANIDRIFNKPVENKNIHKSSIERQ